MTDLPDNAAVLHEPYAQPLPPGAIRAKGWLERQLRIQADGLSGHLDTFWPDVAESRWFGGDAEGWERAPYWLDGFLPLAFVLDDDSLKQRAATRISQILESQQDDGWLGSRKSNASGTEQTGEYDLWAQFLVLKVLVQYFEATGDARIEPAVSRCLQKIDQHVDIRPLFNWAQARWFEALIPIWWLYERRPEEWLLNLAVKLRAQGVDWRGLFERWPFREPVSRGKWGYLSHVVNNAMALREGPLWWRMTGDSADRRSAENMIAMLDQYHGMPTGVFSGDECLHGTDPRQGTELCAVVEYLYSLETLVANTGHADYGDRLERIAFNALPATFSPDMWAHQYDQQVNQVFAGKMADPPWNSNGRDANLYGLEPFFGCCTANLSQGWPKFTTHLWSKRGEDELVAQAWAPCLIETSLSGVPVKIDVATDYPFDESVHITVRTSQPVEGTLHLRIPGWAVGATVEVGSTRVSANTGHYHALRRTWNDGDEVTVHLPMSLRIESRPSGGICLFRGPLMYALRMGEDWRQVNGHKPHRELPHADWEVRATTPWNYALVVDPERGEPDVRFEPGAVGDQPFSPRGAPVRAIVKARRIPEWILQGGVSTPLPVSGFGVAEEVEEVELVPYGATNLRIGEFPTVTG